MSSPSFSNRLKLQIANRFENYVSKLLKNKYENCAIYEQYKLTSGLIPDFVVECDEKLVVVDAKAKEILTRKDVGQVIEYMVELDADSAAIYVEDYTLVPESVEEYAVINGIDIEYTNR